MRTKALARVGVSDGRVTGIDIRGSTTPITLGTTIVNKAMTAGVGVNLGAAAAGNSGSVTFSSLTVSTLSGSALALSIHPRDGKAQLACGNNIVEIALRRVEPSFFACSPPRFDKMRFGRLV